MGLGGFGITLLYTTCILGGLGLGLVDDTIISIEIGYGCTGIGTMIGANGLAVRIVLI